MKEQENSARDITSIFGSWYLWSGLVAALVALGGAGYWFRSEAIEAYSTAQDSVLATLGLGVAPVSLWVGVLLWALVKRRTWFTRFNLWLGSLVFVALVLGVLALFQPYDGAFAVFALDGEGTLGGRVGEAVAGPGGLQGVLRLLGVLVLAAAIAAPRPMLFLASILGKLVVFVYVVLFVAAKAAVSRLRRMYRFEPAPASAEGAGADSPAAEWLAAPAELSQERRARVDALAGRPFGETPSPVQPTGRSMAVGTAGTSAAVPSRARVGEVLGRSEVQTVTLGPPSPTASEDEAKPKSAIVKWLKRLPDPGLKPTETPVDGEPQPSQGKFNKFWSMQASELEGKNGTGIAERPELDGNAEPTDGPIVDVSGSSWVLPSIELLLDAPEGGISQQEMVETAETIKNTLADYSVEVEIGQVRPGPTVTMYGLIPGWVRRYKQVKVMDESGQPKLDESGKPIYTRVETKTRVKVDTITSREKDLALALKTPSLRIETPAMGEALVGIEVPNPSPSLVTLRSVMESEEFKRLRSRAKLPVALGKGSGGETVVLDLAHMPHLLIAGSTGSGKSVCLNTIVSGLLLEKTPAEMRLLLVDPKRVELTPYNGVPHLLTPVVVETDQVVALLKGLIREMLNRYRRLEEVGVRNIDGFNKRMPEQMPYLVVVVDELADLMMSASFDVEQSLCRLAQLGRATGIHLVVATQRPSVDVVTGLIKANFPSRVSFGVTSQIDSRTILDTAGAEKLLGMGDMLYLPSDGARPDRVQGVFISDSEIEELVRSWQSTAWGPLPSVSLHAVSADEIEEEGDGVGGGPESRDQLLGAAVDLAQRYNKLSTSLLQRRMRIGYPRAARLMDQLEEEGVVGPSDGSKSRDVIMSKA